MTNTVGPVVTEVSGEKWSGLCVASLKSSPFHCDHSTIGQRCDPATGPARPSDFRLRDDTSSEEESMSEQPASETGQHTPTPWRISEKQIGETVYRCEIIDANGQRVLLQEVESKPEHEVLVRIVACVNACAGLPLEDLEEDKDVLRLAFRYQRERDDLLAALENHEEVCRSVHPDYDPTDYKLLLFELADSARAAIAKAGTP